MTLAPLEQTVRVLAALLDASPFRAYLVDSHGDILYANRGAATGPLLDLLPEDQREPVRTAMEAVLAGGQPRRLPVAMAEGPGIQHYDAALSPAKGHAQPEILLVLLAEVTERQKREDWLRRQTALLVDAQGVARMGTWEWDVSEPTARWSDELYRIYGLTPDTYTPSYEGYLKMVHPDDRARVMRATEQVFHEHVPYSHDERIFRSDGEMRYLHTWAHPVLDEEGRLVKLIGVCQDVTEQRKAELAFRHGSLTRSVARRLILDLIRRGRVEPNTLREMGRGIAAERTEDATAASYAEAFQELGLGNLRLEANDERRYAFAGSDLLESRSGATLPTCHVTLGYLEGVVSALTGRAALGNEMRCQSMGHAECKFVVMRQ